MKKEINIKKQNLILSVLLIIGLVIRLVLMPISAHSDLFAINNYPPLLISQGVFDIYSYLDKKSPNLFFYPPLTYYLISAFQYIDQSFSDTFLNWMDAQRTLYENGFKGQAAEYIIAAPNPHIFRDLFLAKVPYLVFDILAVYVLWNFVKKNYLSKYSLVVWAFNPVLLYNSYIFGHLDIIPIFFILSAFYILKKNLKISFLLLGVAGALKLYPFMLVPLLVLIYSKSIKEMLNYILLSCLPLVFFLIPTLINNPSLAVSAFTLKLFHAYNGDIHGWEYYSNLIKYSVIVVSYFVLLLFCWKFKIKDSFKMAVGVSLISILLLINFVYRAHFHYLLWLAPYTILWFKNVKTAAIVVIVQAISFASYKILVNPLQAGLFAPLNPVVFSNLPTFNELIGNLIPYRIISTFGFLIFSLTSIWIVYQVLKELVFQEEVNLLNRKQ